MNLLLVTFLSVSFVFGAAAKNLFLTYTSSLDMLEGGKVQTIVVLTDGERLTLRVPQGYGARVDAGRKCVVFTDKTGTTSIAVQVTTNSPGIMPADDILRSKALAANPGASFLQLATCSTGYHPGRFVGTVKKVGENLSIKVQHAFVACPVGVVEFVYSANQDDFDKRQAFFNVVLNSLRVEMLPEAH